MGLYNIDYQITRTFPSRRRISVLSPIERRSLLAGATKDEVRHAVFSMALLKAPGMDGFQANLF